jgi:ribosome-binding protein aMBF1 (putative translation factor)
MTNTRDAALILQKQLGDSPEIRDMIAKERLNVHIARMLYNARTARGLSQKKLAELVGTKQQVIARLEDADYEGHSLSMLQRIADAMGLTLHIDMSPTSSDASHTHA